jgi:hypothetical protein
MLISPRLTKGTRFPSSRLWRGQLPFPTLN